MYPAIAIADAVRELAPEAVIAFAGTRERMEWEAVPKAGYDIHPVTVTGIQRQLSLRNLSFPFKLMAGLAQSWSLVGDVDADVVVGTGGYVSGPVLLMASLRGRPVIVQEQNAYAGLTNKMLGRRATRIHIAFPEAKEYFPADKCVLSGNPTRKELLEAERGEARRSFEVPDDARMLFVFGGSLGSEAINDAMKRHLEALLDIKNVHVLWQTGSRYYDRLRRRVSERPRLHLQKYIDRMDLAYAAADLVLCRAGAITCSELLVTGTPSVLVPSPNVAEDHQTKNAESMEKAGAAVVLPERRLQADLVLETQALLEHDEQRQEMSEAALEAARPEAARAIARDVLSVAGYETSEH